MILNTALPKLNGVDHNALRVVEVYKLTENVPR